MGKLEAYYYQNHINQQKKQPHSSHYNHNTTPNTHPNFTPKTLLLIYNQQLSIPKNSKQMTIINLQPQTKKRDNPNTQLYIPILVHTSSSQPRNKQRIAQTCFHVEYLYKQP